MVALMVFPGPNYFEGISRSYLEVAENILDGKGIVTLVDVAPVSQPSAWRYEPFIDRPLGYVFLILIPLALGGGPAAIQVLHVALSAATAVMTVHVGRKLGSETSAWVAGFLYALWPLSARFEIAVLPDAVMPFFLVGSVTLFLAASQKPSMTLLFATGLLAGVACTMRPDVVFLPAVFLIAIALQRSPRRLLAGAVLVLGTVTVLAAHTIRNYKATQGSVVPLGLGNGISMWEGISQFGDTLGTVYGDERMATLEGYRSWAYPDGVERDRKRFREAVDIIAEHPWWYTTVMLRRIPVLLTPDWIMTRAFAPSYKEYRDQSDEHSVLSYVVDYPLASAIRALLMVLQYVSLALAALALAVRRAEPLLWLPGMVILYYILIHIPTNAEARYFYPVIPLVLLLAAQGWELLRARLQITHAR